MYQREMAKAIREAGSRLSILSDRALGRSLGRLFVRNPKSVLGHGRGGEIFRFIQWAKGKPSVGRQVEKAHHENSHRKAERAATRRARPHARFVLGWDNQRFSDPRIHSRDERPAEVRKVPHEPLMTIHELTDSINRWCAEQGVLPTTAGSKPMVDEQMVRYCCKYSLLDRPGSPSDGRCRGFSQKHACQLRAIRLLQARSLSFADINTILHGRSLPELLEIEQEELCLHQGRAPSDCGGGLQRRVGAPRWA